MNAAVIRSRERWALQHQFCADEPRISSIDQARYVLAVHAGHGPTCMQTLAAGAYITGLDEELA